MTYWEQISAIVLRMEYKQEVVIYKIHLYNNNDYYTIKEWNTIWLN